MKNKRNRLQIITEILRSSVVSNQEELLALLNEKDLYVTQATLSRDLKQLKVSKTPLENGTYKYVLPPTTKTVSPQGTLNEESSHGAVLSLEFSGNLAVIKTKPGYASAIAWDIDNKGAEEVLGTIAGDDTILIIPRDGVRRDQISSLMQVIFVDKNESKR
ncbi:MAG TPA: arginine repressor [Paludibacter sp.]|jgi:transcriptional regulator of arginine metabolism|nr:MAG: Arginine repressor [Bacteroidetes bacterium ADurb.Bin174]HQB28888.1 arginine repressor [Paludibacter sp.]